MKKLLSEYELRAMCLPEGLKEFPVDKETVLTPMAVEYLWERGIRVVEKSAETMPLSTDTEQGKGYVIEGTQQIVEIKPENMTHLHGNVLVSKTHPRIALRGKLDSLEAMIISVQVTATEQRYAAVAQDLQELLQFVRMILSTEVRETALGEFTLWGLDSDTLRYQSHHVHEVFGINHPVPSYTMGRLAAELNLLRTVVRDTELLAVSAFEKEPQMNFVEALNRLSSAVYLIFCKLIAGKYARG